MVYGGTVLVARDNTTLLYIDPRDSRTVYKFFHTRGWSAKNTDEMMMKVIINEEIRQGYQSSYFDVLITVGKSTPSQTQIEALQYALEKKTWFEKPKLRCFNKTSLHICAERGWLALDGNEIRITAEGRRILRCVELDKNDASKVE